MKQLLILITIVLSGLFFTQTTFAQETVRERLAKKQTEQKKQQGLPELTVRAQNMNESQTQDISNAPWMREIYRFLDLSKDKNASLFYPVSPIGDRMNLFTMMFKLLAKGDVKAYTYLLDGREIFTDDYVLKFKDLLDNFGIMYTEENGHFVVDESDVPGNEVQGYYVKEAWYFDKSNSVVDVKTLAIAPVLVRQDDYGTGSERYPLFWMPYENIRPYAARMPIMTSNLNNASTQTVDDFFRKHKFEGEIYKTTNMRNVTLAQAFPTDSLMKKEQKRIEMQLKDFKDRLWAVNDSTSSTDIAKEAKEKAGYQAEVRTNDDKTSNDGKVKAANTKVKSSSSSSSSKQPVRSMRNRRK